MACPLIFGTWYLTEDNYINFNPHQELMKNAFLTLHKFCLIDLVSFLAEILLLFQFVFYYTWCIYLWPSPERVTGMLSRYHNIWHIDVDNTHWYGVWPGYSSGLWIWTMDLWIQSPRFESRQSPRFKSFIYEAQSQHRVYLILHIPPVNT